MKIKDFSLYLSMVLVMLFWGLTFVFFKVAYESFQPITIILLRLCVSVPFIFLAALVLKKRQKVERKDLPYLLLLALFEPFLYFMGESFGLTYVSSTLAAVIIAIIPLLVPIAAYLAYRESLSRMNIIGLITSFAGVLLVIASSGLEMGATLKGVFLMLLAVVSAVAYTTLVKKLSLKYNGFLITAWQNFFGIFLFLPFFLSWEADSFLKTAPETDSILALLYLAIFGSSITFILFTRGVRELGAAKANIFANLIPVFAAVASFLILKEEMPATKILGIAIVIGGLVLSQLKRNRKPKNNSSIPPPHPV